METLLEVQALTLQVGTFSGGRRDEIAQLIIIIQITILMIILETLTLQHQQDKLNRVKTDKNNQTCKEKRFLGSSLRALTIYQDKFNIFYKK